MAKCIFCGKEQADYKGVFLIKNDGIVVYYCSSKCRKNHLKLGRDRRKLKWTEAFHLARARGIVKADLAREKASQAEKSDVEKPKAVKKAAKIQK